MKIIFDLDETLICNHHNPKSSLDKLDLVYSPRLSDQFHLRPHTREVLEKTRSMGFAVFLASFSTKGRVDQVLRASGISDCFDMIFSRSNLDPCYRDEKTATSFNAGEFLLVDDKGIDDKHTQAKLKFFGGDEAVCSDKLLKVSAFDGMETDTELLSVLQEVNRRLQLADRAGSRSYVALREEK